MKYSVKLLILPVLVNHSHCLLSLESPVFHQSCSELIFWADVLFMI